MAPRREVLLEVAAFLDSTHAQGIEGLGRNDVQRIAREVLTIVSEELGKSPAELDGQDMRYILSEALPARMKRNDPAAPEVIDLLHALVAHLEESHVTLAGFELRNALEAMRTEFEAAVESTQTPRRVSPTETLVHRAPKLGRNDPCFCGSGKKFKKCHGKP